VDFGQNFLGLLAYASADGGVGREACEIHGIAMHNDPAHARTIFETLDCHRYSPWLPQVSFFRASTPASLMPSDVTEPMAVNKPRPARSLAALAHGLLADSFARQGFAQSELVTRWTEIAGPEIAAHAEPLKIRWNRTGEGEPTEPATLVLRVEGPAAVE